VLQQKKNVPGVGFFCRGKIHLNPAFFEGSSIVLGLKTFIFFHGFGVQRYDALETKAIAM